MGALVPELAGLGPDAGVPPRAADVPRVETTLTRADRFGALKVRLDIGRYRYRVEPGLYRVGEPDATSPVLVTANYKLTFDAVRKELTGIDAWLLVLDTKGINVWCAAGKGTFGTKELCAKILSTNLHDVVEHRTVIVPQLGAPGIAAHEVKAFTDFRVVYGPVRAADIPAYLEAGMKATDEMRHVTFNMRDRVTLTGTELSWAWKPKTLAIMAAVVLASGIYGMQFSWRAVVLRGGFALLAAIAGLIAGGFVTPLLLPWVPGRMFALKGAIVGAVFAIPLTMAA